MGIIPSLALLTAILLSPGWLHSDTEEPASFAERHRRWLEEVVVLLTEEEYDAFVALRQDYRRDLFIERFWRAHDPHPETARNEFRDLWEARLEQARSGFGTLQDARAQIYLLAGPPAVRTRGSCPSQLKPIEIWRFTSGPGLERSFSIVFLKDFGSRSVYRVWSAEEGLYPLLLETASTPFASGQITEFLRRECSEADEVLTHLERSISLEVARQAATTPAPEWVATFLSRSTKIEDDARTFVAELALSFPDRYRSRTVMEAAIGVPLAQVSLSEADGSYRFLVDGEILRQGKLFESFRYRFDMPADSIAGDIIPLVVQRYLRPGAYTLVLRVEDLVGQSFFRDSREIQVPPAPARPSHAATTTAPPTALMPAAPASEQDVALEQPPSTRTTTTAAASETSITLVRPPTGLRTGKLRVYARTTGEAIAKVAFELDGRLVMSKRRPPWSIEIDLGEAPRLHALKAIALGNEGQELATDEITVNAGPQRFAVRLAEPEPGRRYRGSIHARAIVDVPRGARLDRLEFFLNEVRLSTLYQGPFVQTLPLPEASELAYVRAVAYLEDGHSTESLVFVNAPAHLDHVEIDLVELYISVADRRGRPVEGLDSADFRVYENKVEQTIRRFERAQNLPFHAAVVIDTSISMAEEIREAEKAATAFFEKMVTPRDRAAVVTFSDEPRLVVPFTSDLKILADGLSGMEAEGNTALHDSIVFTLYHFGGLRGQRALILLSDGLDSSSRFSFNETLDFARQSGVAIYAIGLGIPSNDHEARSKLIRLCRETGGRHFSIARAAELDRVYQIIEHELRSQYLIAYQSSNADDPSYREIEVKLSDSSLKAKTIRGYDP